MTTTGPAAGQGEDPAGRVSPEPILRLASGFMAAKHLFAASDLGIFEALAESPATLDALAARTGVTRRAARISADAMVALGLLERIGELYGNAPEAAHYLAGRTPTDLRPLLKFWDQISYPAWEALAQALGSGPPREVFDLDEAQQEIVSAGIEAILAGPAQALTEVVDFSVHRRLLDVGGGTGSWSIAAVQRHPHLHATVLDLPVTAEIARRRLQQASLGDRVAVIAGDAMSEQLPDGHDVFLVANLIHYWSPEDNIALLRRVREAAPDGGRLLLADFWTDPTHTQPVQAALMAGEFAVHLRDGDRLQRRRGPRVAGRGGMALRGAPPARRAPERDRRGGRLTRGTLQRPHQDRELGRAGARLRHHSRDMAQAWRRTASRSSPGR